MYEWIIQNKGLLKILYSLIIVLICAIIVAKTNHLFKISLHQGIRYFRNAFFFYGIGFAIRYFSGFFYLKYTSLLFEFFLIMAGFFLLYSLIWKRVESSEQPQFSSLFNAKILLFYLMAFVIALLDQLWGTHNFMFLSQIILFTSLTAISYTNYKRNNQKGNFLKFYFIAMLLSLIAWVLNFLANLIFNWSQLFLMSVYGLNIIIFLLFLYGVVKFTSK